MRQTQNTQKKNNRRSILVIGLLLMLVAVIGFGGYTLSKYVTKKETSANASVAKWGFTVDADATGLFGSKYSYNNGKSTVNTATNPDAATLTVSADANRVAPGTTGSMTFKVTGTAEVKAQIKIEMTVKNDVVLNYTKDGVAGTAYTPVKWTLTKKGTTDAIAEGTLADIKAELDKVAITYNANATAIDEEYTLTWAWAFENNDVADADALDTLLGMVANANGAVSTNEVGANKFVSTTETNTTVEFVLAISITQLAQ